MSVRVQVIHTDDARFDVHTAIEVTNPAQPGRGHAWVADDGSVRWECRCTPAQGTGGLAPGCIARTIATVLASQNT
jgi:hypothetical protein